MNLIDLLYPQLAAAAPASRWPMFDLRDEHWTVSPFEHRARTTAPISIGSPRAVPVPCASRPTACAKAAETAVSKRYCEVPFGAVRDALGPSCCTADTR